MDTIQQFIVDNTCNRGISANQALAISALVDSYRKITVNVGDTVIMVDFGKFGNIEIRHVVESEFTGELKYEYGEYDYISIVSDSNKVILFTDYSDEEPYNRQGSLYVSMSWKRLNLVEARTDYREFYHEDNGGSMTFGVWGFCYNNYWDSLKFGMCIDSDKADQFVSELRALLNK